MTNFFMLDLSSEGDVIIRGSDLALVLFIILIPVVYLRDKSIFAINGDELTKWVYLFVLFYIVELIITIFSGRESLINGLKVIRVSFVGFGFFAFKCVPVEKFEQFIRVALLITLVQSVLFLLQFAGIHLIAGSSNDGIQFSYTDFSNIPTLTVFFIFFLLKMESYGKKRYILLIFLLLIALLSFVRGTIIAILFGLSYYLLVNSDLKRRIPLALTFLVLIPISYRVISIKSDLSSSGLEDIAYVFSRRNDFTSIDKGRGSFSFRMAMLSERVVWLTEHSQFLLTGVGTMHEDSPQTLKMFPFSIGTNNEDRAYGYTLIESGDITWVPIVLRYGLLGVFLHLMMLVILFKASKRRTDILVMLSSLTVYLLIRSFDGALFERTELLFLLFLYYSMVSRATYENEVMIL